MHDFLIDTNIAIHVRDKSANIMDCLEDRNIVPILSMITRVELEGGLDREPSLAPIRRLRLDEMLLRFEWLAFDHHAAAEYGRIVKAMGFSRTRVLDRMIAAQAIAADATLITINASDFKDIPRLKLEIWPSPPPLA